MDLHDSNKGSIQIVSLRGFSVQDFDRESSSRDGEDGTVVEISGKLLSIEGG